METVTAIANSKIKLRVARICLVFGENLSLHRAINSMMLMKKVSPAAIIRKAANWLKSLYKYQ